MATKNSQSAVFYIVVLFFLVIVFSLFLTSHPVSAGASCGNAADGNPLHTSFDYGCPSDTASDASNLERNPIYVVLLYAVNFLAAGVGIAVVGFIVWGSIMYAGSDGTAETAKRGVSYITNAVIGLILFLAMYAIINYLIPGGLLN